MLTSPKLNPRYITGSDLHLWDGGGVLVQKERIGFDILEFKCKVKRQKLFDKK
jgi:hypothetical protein